MKSVRTPTGMLLVILSPKLALGGELHTTVIEKTIRVDGSIVLKGGKKSDIVNPQKVRNEGGKVEERVKSE